MQPQAQQVEQTIVAHDPICINTKWGAVAVFGHEFVSNKDIEIIAKCLTLKEFMDANHRVKSIIFRNDNKPKDENGTPLLANMAPDLGGVCINLQQTFQVAFEDTQENPEISMAFSYHRNLIMSYLHEIHHLYVLDDGGAVTKETLKLEEEAAEEFSMEALIRLAKTTDIEPDYLKSAFFCEMMEKLFADYEVIKQAAKDGQTDLDWDVDRQKHMYNNHILYHYEAEGSKDLVLHNFKTVVQLMGNIDPNDPEWRTAEGTAPLAEAINAVDTSVQEVENAPPLPTITVENTEVYDDNDLFDEVNYDDMEVEYDDYESFPQTAVAQPMYNQFPVAQAEVAPVNPVVPTAPMAPNNAAEIARGVYMKLYNHIFANCGRLLNSDKAFANPEQVCIPVQLTEEEKAIVVGMDCKDANGRWCSCASTVNGVKGYISNKINLPIYKLYLNINGGKYIRFLLPQNTATNSAPAKQAREGACIMYINEGDDAILQAGGQKWITKIVNGELQ